MSASPRIAPKRRPGRRLAAAPVQPRPAGAPGDADAVIDQDPRPDQALRRPRRRRSPQPRGPRRRDLRPARPERGRQDHDDPDAARIDRADRGDGAGRRPRPDPRPARGQATRRLHARQRRVLHDLTGRENLRYTAKLNRMDKATTEETIEHVLDQVGLADRADDPTETYSRGHAPASRHRRCAGQGPRCPHPRRADDRHRPARRGRGARPAAFARARAGHGHPAVEPPAQPGPERLRPDRHLRVRPADRAGDHGGSREAVRRRPGASRGRVSTSPSRPTSSARVACWPRSTAWRR